MTLNFDINFQLRNCPIINGFGVTMQIQHNTAYFVATQNINKSGFRGTVFLSISVPLEENTVLIESMMNLSEISTLNICLYSVL